MNAMSNAMQVLAFAATNKAVNAAHILRALFTQRAAYFEATGCTVNEVPSSSQLAAYANSCYDAYVTHLNKCRTLQQHQELYEALKQRMHDDREFFAAKP